MNASASTIAMTSTPAAGRTLAMSVGDDVCLVRAVSIWPIAEVLDFEQQFDGLSRDESPENTDLIADALASQMIAAPRPRRRRDRAVSSRAHFYSGE